MLSINYDINEKNIVKQSCEKCQDEVLPANWAVSEGGRARDAGGKVATWKKYNSNLKVEGMMKCKR